MHKIYRDRETNLAYNTFSNEHFQQIMKSAALETTMSADKLRNIQASRQSIGAMTGGRGSISPSVSGNPQVAASRVLNAEFKNNQDFSKEGAYLRSTKQPNFEVQLAREQYKAIGWGIDNPRIDHGLTNVQKERIPKPSLKWLDNAKKSNFLNYLYTKKNEINHERQDFAHPAMFYLTRNVSSVRHFQKVEKQFTSLELRTQMKKLRRLARNSLGPPSTRQETGRDSHALDRSQPARVSATSSKQQLRQLENSPHHFRSGDLSQSVLSKKKRAQNLQKTATTVGERYRKEHLATAQNFNGTLSLSPKPQHKMMATDVRHEESEATLAAGPDCDAQPKELSSMKQLVPHPPSYLASAQQFLTIAQPEPSNISYAVGLATTRARTTDKLQRLTQKHQSGFQSLISRKTSANQRHPYLAEGKKNRPFITLESSTRFKSRQTLPSSRGTARSRPYYATIEPDSADPVKVVANERFAGQRTRQSLQSSNQDFSTAQTNLITSPKLLTQVETNHFSLFDHLTPSSSRVIATQQMVRDQTLLREARISKGVVSAKHGVPLEPIAIGRESFSSVPMSGSNVLASSAAITPQPISLGCSLQPSSDRKAGPTAYLNPKKRLSLNKDLRCGTPKYKKPQDHKRVLSSKLYRRDRVKPVAGSQFI